MSFGRRRLELAAGGPRGEVRPETWAANEAIREAERELARQADAAYKRTVADWHRAQAKKGAIVTTGRASDRPSGGEAARQTISP